MKRSNDVLTIIVLLMLFLLIGILLNSCQSNPPAQGLSPSSSPLFTTSEDIEPVLPDDTPGPVIEEPDPIKSTELIDYEMTDADLQYPNYPTGCEGVSASVMLRMNGIEVSNEKFMEFLPQGSGEDFVHAFWGDPSTHAGFACMAPAITETCRKLVPLEKTVLDLTGTDLVYLPTPCTVWTTMYFTEPIETEYEQEGYKLFYNTHCVVLLSCDDHQAHIWDPMQGYVDVPFSTFDHIYNVMGKQAVYIAPRGYGNE